jgi:hypothetical protein
MKKVFIGIGVLVLIACIAAFLNRDQIFMMIAFGKLKPEHSFTEAPPPAAPDYAVAHQGRHHRRQARRPGRLDHQAADRLRPRPRRGLGAAHGQQQSARRRDRGLEERRRDRARRHADAVRAALTPGAPPRARHGRPRAAVIVFTGGAAACPHPRV